MTKFVSQLHFKVQAYSLSPTWCCVNEKEIVCVSSQLQSCSLLPADVEIPRILQATSTTTHQAVTTLPIAQTLLSSFTTLLSSFSNPPLSSSNVSLWVLLEPILMWHFAVQSHRWALVATDALCNFSSRGYSGNRGSIHTAPWGSVFLSRSVSGWVLIGLKQRWNTHTNTQACAHAHAHT